MSSYIGQSETYWTTGTSGGTSAVVARVPGVQDGDRMFAFVFVPDAAVTAPAGWTLLYNYFDYGKRLYTKAASSEPATYTWSWTGTKVYVVRIAAYRGWPNTQGYSEGEGNRYWEGRGGGNNRGDMQGELTVTSDSTTSSAGTTATERRFPHVRFCIAAKKVAYAYPLVEAPAGWTRRGAIGQAENATLKFTWITYDFVQHWKIEGRQYHLIYTPCESSGYPSYTGLSSPMDDSQVYGIVGNTDSTVTTYTYPSAEEDHWSWADLGNGEDEAWEYNDTPTAAGVTYNEANLLYNGRTNPPEGSWVEI
jgi:hypothetical protein